MTWVEKARSLVAEQAVSEIKDGMILGLGSGMTVAKALLFLAEKVKTEGLQVKGVPTSTQTELLCIDNGIHLTSLNEHPQLDLAIDGADQVDVKNLNLIKGGGAALMMEKIVATASKRFIVLVDEEKVSQEGLNRAIPLEVLPQAYKPCFKAIIRLGGKPTLRMAEKKMGPIITDNGNYVFDADFGRIDEPEILENDLKSIPGILETGFFLGMAHRVYVGLPDGNLKILEGARAR